MRNITVVAFALSACASSGSRPEGAANTNLKAATYTADADIGVEEGEPMTTNDCLTIRPAPDGGLAYEFVFAFPYDHACSMEGTATPIAPGVWQESRGDCRLVLTLDHGAWSVDDPDSTCRAENCGARGSIGHVFKTSTAAPARACQ